LIRGRKFRSTTHWSNITLESRSYLMWHNAVPMRSWWTNLAPLLVLQLVLKYTIRYPNLHVFHILDDQNSYQPITRQEKPPWFPANTIGKPRGAWPTFVSFPWAHAFQGDDQAWCIVMLQPLGMNQTQKKEKGLWGSKFALLVTLRWLNWSVTLY